MDKNRAMNNAEKFKEVFGYYATEMWAKPEQEFLNWLNAEYEDRPKGEWVHEYDENGLPTFKNKWRCPVCGKSQTYGQPNHCPNCGARLGREEVNNDAKRT